MFLHWMARAVSLFGLLCLLTSAEGFLYKGFICPKKKFCQNRRTLNILEAEVIFALEKRNLVRSQSFIFNNKPFHTTLCPFEVIVGDGGNFVVVLCYLHICQRI